MKSSKMTPTFSSKLDQQTMERPPWYLSRTLREYYEISCRPENDKPANVNTHSPGLSIFLTCTQIWHESRSQPYENNQFVVVEDCFRSIHDEEVFCCEDHFRQCSLPSSIAHATAVDNASLWWQSLGNNLTFFKNFIIEVQFELSLTLRAYNVRGRDSSYGDITDLLQFLWSTTGPKIDVKIIPSDDDTMADDARPPFQSFACTALVRAVQANSTIKSFCSAIFMIGISRHPYFTGGQIMYKTTSTLDAESTANHDKHHPCRGKRS